MPGRLAAVACLLAASALGADGPPTPEESRAAIRVADPALAVELAAAEPDVAGPVAAAWDEFGRLYVVEMTDYPKADTGGRVKRLEDRDGDGRYERVTVFADGLRFPSGVLPWNGGVLVTAAPDLLFFKDDDGDGRADTRRVILTGFAEGNQQLRVNSPTWGLDNWVYLANGRSGGAVRRPADPPAKAVAIPRNDLRVKPETGAVEPVAGFSQFGLPRDDWGDRFPSWNTVPVRHAVLEPPAGPAAAGARTVAEILDPADGGRVYSLAPAQRRFNAETVRVFNATCGPTVYRADLLGPAYRGNVFVCEPLVGVVHRRRLDPDGPTFVARRVDAERDREFLASTHSWFRPVNLATGPDGALWVVDFCRAWVEHPDFVPEAQRTAVDFREGHDHGRLWRVVPRAAGARPKPCLPGPDTGAALVAHFDHPNGWCRDTAQRLLVERHDLSAVGPLRTLARESPSPLARVHALWTLDGLGALDAETLRAGLRAGDPHVREQAARLAAPRAGEYAGELAGLADDPDARVRLRAAVGLGGLDTDAAREALVGLAARDAGSPWVLAAVLGGPAVRPARLIARLADRPPAWASDPSPAQAGFLGALAGRVSDPAEARSVAEAAAKAPSEGFAFALVHGLDAVRPADAGAVRDRAAAAARSADRPPWLRALALDVALAGRPPGANDLILALLDPAQPAEVQTAAARGLARAGDAALADAVLARWDGYALATRRVLLGALSGSEPLAARLLEAVAAGTVAAAEVDPGTRAALRGLGSPAFRARVAAVLAAAPAADRGAVVRRYEPALSLTADAARGRDLFARNCQTCHARGGPGPRVGPDLATVAGRPAADLLVAILDPSREVAPDGTGVVVVTHDGRTLTGLLAEETPAGVRLRRAEGLEDVIPRAEIEALRPTGRSLMPDGLEQTLAPQDLADLIAFLRGPLPVTPR